MRLSLLSLCLALCACGQSSTVKVHLLPNVIAGAQDGTATSQLAGVSARTSALRIGSPAATNLKSLKYYVISIQICQDVQVMGSGYSSASGCLALYTNPETSPPDYNNYVATQAKDDVTPGRFIDLMTADGQAALRRPVTLEIPAPKDDGKSEGQGTDGGPSLDGAYRFGLINFYRPIKVTAEFPIIGQPDQYFRTRAITNIISGRTMDGRFNTERVEIGDSLSGPTEETTYMLNNGGALFTFQKPFVITKADVDAQAEIKVDLVFNPENFGQAFETSGCNADSAICDPTNNVVIDMPFVRMSPVPRKAGEHTRKETYLMDYDAASKLRIELYYNDGDTEAGIQGVDTAIVYTAPSNMTSRNVIASNYVSQTGSVRSNDASVSLQDYQHTPNLTGLLRRQDGTATVQCLFPGSLCPSVGATAPRPYTFVGDSLVSAD